VTTTAFRRPGRSGNRSAGSRRRRSAGVGSKTANGPFWTSVMPPDLDVRGGFQRRDRPVHRRQFDRVIRHPSGSYAAGHLGRVMTVALWRRGDGHHGRRRVVWIDGVKVVCPHPRFQRRQWL
jgi:hypothetical protein